MIIRRATMDDVPAIAEISREFGYEPTAADVAVSLQDLLTRVDHAVFVAELQGSVQGWGHARINRQLESPRYAEIAGLVVTRSQRSQGIGAAIVGAIEQWAWSQGERSLRVRSNVVRERAHRFYLRQGYAELKQQKTFVKPLSGAAEGPAKK